MLGKAPHVLVAGSYNWATLSGVGKCPPAMATFPAISQGVPVLQPQAPISPRAAGSEAITVQVGLAWRRSMRSTFATGTRLPGRTGFQVSPPMAYRKPSTTVLAM